MLSSTEIKFIGISVILVILTGLIYTFIDDGWMGGWIAGTLVSLILYESINKLWETKN